MQLSFRLKKKPEFIFDYLTDMQKFVSIHPVIFQIDKISENNYLVHETLKFMFIPFSFTYPIIIEKNIIDKVIIMHATVFKLTKIEIKFSLKQDNDYTIVGENIQFKSFLPILFMLKSIFKKHHNQLFKNLEMK